jgi:hypothetical protein
MSRKQIYINENDENDTKKNVHSWRIDFQDLHDSFKRNWQVNTNYEISFILTYSEDYKGVFNAAKEKCGVWYDGYKYRIQQREEKTDEQGMQTAQITATADVIDVMKNIRIDQQEPTEDNPDINDSSSKSDNNDSDDPKQPGVVTKRTDEQQTYTLKDRLDKFVNNNDQGFTYDLHGNFIQAAVDCSGSLYEWLGSNLKLFGAYWLPKRGKKGIDIYDLASLQHKTGKQFRYLFNTPNADVQIDVVDLVNDCEVYGGKMEKDITSGGAGGGGNLDNVEGFCKSPINADFGVNKGAMLADFANRSQRVHAWGVDVNRLYDTVKSAGVSPEWFFAYELMEQGTYYGWLNHTYRHGDPYQDAVSVCEWIKECANSDSINPAWSAPEGSMAPNPALQAKWNQEFGKGSIGRCYLQGTAAAVWDLAGVTPNPAIGKPITGCVNVIKGWGGHTVTGSAGASKWIQVAKSFVGIPYVWGGGHSGNNPRAGMDCSGLGEQIAKACGLDIGGGNTVTLEAGSTDISRDQVQTGDMGFFGARGNSYHVIWALDNNTYIAEPDVGKTCYIGNINDYQPNFWKRNPQIAAFVGSGSSAGGNADDLNTTSETYYALHFHYTDEDSVKKYGLHRGAPVVVDSIYDMDALKKYVDQNVQHTPQTSLTISGTNEEAQIGDVWRLIVPEFNNMNVDVTVMGISGNVSEFNTDPQIEITLNNTALAMKDINAAMLGIIRSINRPENIIQQSGSSSTSSRVEDHFANIAMFSEADMSKVKAFMGGS